MLQNNKIGVKRNYKIMDNMKHSIIPHIVCPLSALNSIPYNGDQSHQHIYHNFYSVYWISAPATWKYLKYHIKKIKTDKRNTGTWDWIQNSILLQMPPLYNFRCFMLTKFATRKCTQIVLCQEVLEKQSFRF